VSAGRASWAARWVSPLFSSRIWLAIVYLVTGPPLGIVSFVITLVGLVLGVVLLPLALLGLPILIGTLLLSGYLAALERQRAALMLDVVVQRPQRKAPAGPGLWQKGRAVLTDALRWRELGCGLLALPTSVVGLSISNAVWSLALALIALPAYSFALPKGGVSAGGWVLRGAASLAGAVALGVVLLLLAPRVTVGITRVLAWTHTRLVGPSREQALATRVGELERSRSRMVVAADSERRRIERDLHDGAQARLVSLAMELGRAKARFDEDPEAAKALVEQAHEEAKAALVELRGLVRGVHPPVLTDRGLDAALSGLAAICSVPVAVKTAMAGRPPAAMEAVAYFVVAEALTNVAKHSGATNAIVDVRYDGLVLHGLVIDDGHGGAQADGAGLSGLADRVQAVDGRLSVDSPPGGPTVIEVQLPCG
jgi:signal transduction histidine kinase